jgi:cobalt-zinc-cadmium efflux system membrane fusion protein
MLVTARITRLMPPDSVLIPANAALLVGIRHLVFVQSAANAFEPRDVEVAHEGAKDVVISKGLKAGDMVVTDNTLLLGRLWRLSQDNASIGAPSATSPGTSQATPSKAPPK